MADLNPLLVRQLIDWHGGFKAVAAAADLTCADLAAWSKAEGELPEDAARCVLQLIGIPKGVPDQRRLHAWRAASNDQWRASVLEGFFSTRPEFVEVICPQSEQTIYALTDGQLRAVLSASWKGCIERDELLRWASWKDGAPGLVSVLARGDQLSWSQGAPSMTDFDETWRGSDRWAVDDLERVMAEQGLSVREAVQRLRREGA